MLGAGIEPASHAFQAGAKTTSATPAWVIGGTRTRDGLIHSQALYQLSYDHSREGGTRTHGHVLPEHGVCR